MSLHGVSFVSPQAQIRERLGGTDQGETGPLVFGVVTAGVRVVELALQHSYGTGQIPALLAGRREVEPGAACGVEDVLLGATTQRPCRAVWQLELDFELSCLFWIQGLRVVEAGVLRVRALTRSTAAEVARGIDGTVALHRE